MARIRQFCVERGIALIEDCAHAMFGEADGKPIGAHGHYAIASLTKFLPTVDGDASCTAEAPRGAPMLAPRSVADQLRIIANTVETGAQHNRLPGMNRVITAGFAAADALRGRRRPATIATGEPLDAPDAQHGGVRAGLEALGRRVALVPVDCPHGSPRADRRPPAPELPPPRGAPR